jgi:mRNA-degrading endonuclease RelE of RelBE toxin-antitoxin system
VYAVRWDEGALDDLRRMKLRAYEVRQIVDAVDEQLTHEPDRESKRKKIIRPGEDLPFEHLEPVWQLRVGEYRVFYDVAEREEERPEIEPPCEGVVSIRAVRHKPGHKTTREIL